MKYKMKSITLEEVRKIETKFRIKYEGESYVAYYINSSPRNVIKIDGQHTYLWERDERITEYYAL